MDALIRIPLGLYDDHEARDLPTPALVKRTSKHGWIRADDPALPELMDDARYYLDPYGPGDAVPGLPQAARALIRAVSEPQGRNAPAQGRPSGDRRPGADEAGENTQTKEDTMAAKATKTSTAKKAPKAPAKAKATKPKVAKQTATPKAAKATTAKAKTAAKPIPPKRGPDLPEGVEQVRINRGRLDIRVGGHTVGQVWRNRQNIDGRDQGGWVHTLSKELHFGPGSKRAAVDDLLAKAGEGAKDKASKGKKVEQEANA